MKRKLTKWDSLKVLTDAGLTVGTVIDIGVQRDTPELRLTFPSAPHILFEPMAEYMDAIDKNYAGMNYVIENISLSDRDGVMFLEEVRKDESGVVSHVHPSLFIKEGTRQIPTRSLDNYLHDAWVSGSQAAKPYLIKIDVDGHETEIMRGAKNSLRDTSCLIVETTLFDLAERCVLAEKAGLRLWDIVDVTFYRGSMYQLDLIFISGEEMEKNLMLDPRSSIGIGEIDKSEWYSHQAGSDST